MNYSINKFFTPEECLYTIEYIEKHGTHFSYTKDMESWYCKRIPKDEFGEKVIEKFYSKYKEGSLKLWFPLEEFNIQDFNLSLTKYSDGRWLDLHVDESSQLTSVVVLTEGFSDGRFLLSNSARLTDKSTKLDPLAGETPGSKLQFADKLHIHQGEILTFNGTELYHGVLPVTSGVRYSLNIWMTDTNYKFFRPGKRISVL